ncbi:MAG: YbhB/YbcL family Raf kinase inhibitor-like protein [Kofleriaceae bacterium]|nr:MAG: YbhB/YbcL family Raf kinase inhibitor-like protein [Kofleriaceae bacterium]MBZ0237909.1 YbhB/YbcL family Raf kinase inhibitor-like protein [Kofleriaceae bacterium]
MRSSFLVGLLLSGVAACGGDDDGAGAVDAPATTDAASSDGGDTDAAIDGSTDGPSAVLALTSTAITEGGVIPDMYSCQGTNVSPPLAWTGGPAAAGYAVVLTDTSNMLVHSIIWDIPAATTSLPENVMKVYMPPVPAGARQPLAYDNQTRGYLGPCPSSMHTYQFALYAVDANPLPGVGVTLGMGSTRNVVLQAILAHDTATATLTATFTP